MCIHTTSCLFICRWTLTLLPCLGCKQGCSEHWGACVYLFIYLFKILNYYLFIWLLKGYFNCSMWDLVPGPGIKPRPPALGAQRLNHWATREVPVCLFLATLCIIWDLSSLTRGRTRAPCSEISES